MNKLFVFLLAAALCLGFASAALATDWIDYVDNNELSQRGVASSPHITNRHASGYEAYYIETADFDTNDILQWMIFENGTGGDFDLKHKKINQYGSVYEDVTVAYSIGTGAYRRLKMEWSSGTTWNLYYEGTLIKSVSWKDQYGNGTGTLIKVLSYSPVHYFMGRHYDIWFKNSSGSWVQQGSSYNVSGPMVTGSGNPYTNTIWNTMYWDWEART